MSTMRVVKPFSSAGLKIKIKSFYNFLNLSYIFNHKNIQYVQFQDDTLICIIVITKDVQRKIQICKRNPTEL